MNGTKALTFDTLGTIHDWDNGIRAKLAEIVEREGVEADWIGADWAEDDWGAMTNIQRRRSLATMTLKDR